MGLIQRCDLPTEVRTPTKLVTTYQFEGESKRFSKENADGDRFTFSFQRQLLTLKHPSGKVIVFSKTNRSNFYKDSREPRKQLLGCEVLSELERLLGDKAEAAQAMATLR